MQTEAVAHVATDVVSEEKRQAADLTAASINSALAKVERESANNAAKHKMEPKKPTPPIERNTSPNKNSAEPASHRTEENGKPLNTKAIQKAPIDKEANPFVRRPSHVPPTVTDTNTGRKKSVSSARLPQQDKVESSVAQTARPQQTVAANPRTSVDAHNIQEKVVSGYSTEVNRPSPRNSSQGIQQPVANESKRQSKHSVADDAGLPSLPASKKQHEKIESVQLSPKQSSRDSVVGAQEKEKEHHPVKQIPTPVNPPVAPLANKDNSPTKIPKEDRNQTKKEDSQVSKPREAKVSPPSPRKPTVPLDVGHIAAPKSDIQSPPSPQRKTDAMWPLLPEKSTPRIHFDRQEQRAVANIPLSPSRSNPVDQPVREATVTMTEGQTGRRVGELVSVGERKIFRIVGDPVIDAMEERVKERKEKERVRKEKEEKKLAELQAAEERRQAELQEEKLRIEAEEAERKRLEVQRRRDKIRQMEEDRVKRLAKGQLKPDMDIITGSKSTLEKFEDARRRDQIEEEAALAARLSAVKAAAKNRRGSKLKLDIQEHAKVSMERERLEAEQRKLREQEAREKQKAMSTALEATLSGTTATSDLVAAMSSATGAEVGGLSKALQKIRKEEEERRKAANEQKLSPRTVTVSPPKPFKTKPFAPAQAGAANKSRSHEPQGKIEEPADAIQNEPVAPNLNAPSIGSPKSKRYTQSELTKDAGSQGINATEESKKAPSQPLSKKKPPPTTIVTTAKSNPQKPTENPSLPQKKDERKPSTTNENGDNTEISSGPSKKKPELKTKTESHTDHTVPEKIAAQAPKTPSEPTKKRSSSQSKNIDEHSDNAKSKENKTKKAPPKHVAKSDSDHEEVVKANIPSVVPNEVPDAASAQSSKKTSLQESG